MTDPRVVVLTPWRPDDHRVRLYQAIRPHVAALDLPVIEGDEGGEVFSLARTWNHLAALAEPWDVALLHEADYWIPHAQLRAAVGLVAEGYEGQVFAYDRHVKLTQHATDRFLLGERGPWRPQDVRIGRYRTGGPRAVSRALWDAVGGFDNRFVGWGYEDNAFGEACERIAPATRVPGDLTNLWHPRHNPADPYYQARAANHALLEAIRAT